jgi:hypothetical protein
MMMGYFIDAPVSIQIKNVHCVEKIQGHLLTRANDDMDAPHIRSYRESVVAPLHLIRFLTPGPLRRF